MGRRRSKYRLYSVPAQNLCELNALSTAKSFWVHDLTHSLWELIWVAHNLEVRTGSRGDSHSLACPHPQFCKVPCGVSIYKCMQS